MNDDIFIRDPDETPVNPVTPVAGTNPANPIGAPSARPTTPVVVNPLGVTQNVAGMPGATSAVAPTNVANPAVPADPNDPSQDQRPEGDRVFDITPDLNISAVKENVSVPLAKKPALSRNLNENEVPRDQLLNDLVQKMAAEAMGQKPNTPSQSTSPVANNPTVVAGASRRPTAYVIPSGPPQTEVPRHAFTTQLTPEDQALLKPIRTYEGDIAEMMSHKRPSTASIVIAENKRATGQNVIATKEPEEVKHTWGHVAIIAASLILIVGGLAAAYYLYSSSTLFKATSTATKPVPIQTLSSIIKADSQILLSLDNQNTNTTLSKIQSLQAKALPANTIQEIIPTQTIDGVKTRMTGPEMLTFMGIQPPDILTRSLTDSWMLGVYSDSQAHNSVFIVATENFFQNSFAGMLQWEGVMADDLRPFIGVSNQIKGIADTSSIPATTPPPTILPGTTTAKTLSTKTATTTKIATSTKAGTSRIPKLPLTGTSTIQNSQNTTTPAIIPDVPISASVTPYATLRGQFQDRIVMNKDVREFITNDGKTLFLYSFLDNNTLVMAANEATLSAIIDRLDKQAFVR